MVTLARSKEQGKDTQDLFDKTQGLSYLDYLMKHCRVYHKKHYCPYLKDADFTVEGCDGHCIYGGCER